MRRVVLRKWLACWFIGSASFVIRCRDAAAHRNSTVVVIEILLTATEKAALRRLPAEQ